MTNESKIHYVCTGTCGGVSDTPTNCQDASCNLYGEPLRACSCEDGMHREDVPTGATAIAA